MNFKPELAEMVSRGEKTVTRRLVSDNPRSPWFRDACSLRPGRTYAVCPGRGKEAICRVVVADVRRIRLGYLDDEEARLEGFETAAAFRTAWEQINGSYDPAALVWRVRLGERYSA